MKLERLDESGSAAAIADQRVGSIEEAVSFEPTESRQWRLTLRTGKTPFLVLRGLDFRRKGKPVVPRLIPPALEDRPGQ